MSTCLIVQHLLFFMALTAEELALTLYLLGLCQNATPPLPAAPGHTAGAHRPRAVAVQSWWYQGFLWA